MKAIKDCLSSASTEYGVAQNNLYNAWFEYTCAPTMNALRDLISKATEAKRTLEIYEKLKEDAE